MNVTVALKGIKKFERNLENYRFAVVKNMNTALRISGFRLKNKLQEEIRTGAPGGQKFAPLTILGKKWFYSRRESSVLTRLRLGVRYHVPNTLTPLLQVGFVGPINAREHSEMVQSGIKFGSNGFRGISRSQMSSASWRNLAYKHQKGFRKEITETQRLSLFRRANEYSAKNPQLSGMFASVARNRREFITPARPIIQPFWKRYEASTLAEIKRNWGLKMQGERI